MQTRRRHSTPLWERGRTGATNRTRRSRRYPRAYDGGQTTSRSRGRTGLQRIRANPIRSGLIGMAIAGTAAPLAMHRYESVTRVDPSHEQTVQMANRTILDDSAVAMAWRAAEAGLEPAVEVQREQIIDTNIKRYQEYDISRQLAEEIYDQAIEAEIDPDVAFGLVHAESSFKNSATSHVGAVGLTQLMPKTADWLEPGTSRDELRNQQTNLRIGFRYLRDLIDKYDGDTKLALIAYNRGPGTVDRVLKKGGNPDNGYAELVNKRRS